MYHRHILTDDLQAELFILALQQCVISRVGTSELELRNPPEKKTSKMKISKTVCAVPLSPRTNDVGRCTWCAPPAPLNYHLPSCALLRVGRSLCGQDYRASDWLRAWELVTYSSVTVYIIVRLSSIFLSCHLQLWFPRGHC